MKRPARWVHARSGPGSRGSCGRAVCRIPCSDRGRRLSASLPTRLLGIAVVSRNKLVVGAYTK